MRLEGDREEQMPEKENQDAIEGGNGGCGHTRQMFSAATSLPLSPASLFLHILILFSLAAKSPEEVHSEAILLGGWIKSPMIL